MGNAACAGKPGALEALCCDRGLPTFIAPNTEGVTFCFDYTAGEDLKLHGGLAGPLSPDGFRVESLHHERRPAKWYTIKESAACPAKQRVCISGRALVQCPQQMLHSTPQRGFCAMKVCTRGRPVFQSVRTKTFTHTAQVTTSGVCFALFVSSTGGSLFLCPRILLVLDTGDEVMLVDDRLGPLQVPLSFHVDFAVLDDGGRNLQMDLIFRGSPSSPGDEMKARAARTLRTCLQEYSAYNNQVQPAGLCIGSCELEAFMPGSVVFLQNLVISEEKFEVPVPEPTLHDIWAQSLRPLEREPAAAMFLFEGSDARTASVLPSIPEGAGSVPAALEASLERRQQSADSFWYHIRYDDEKNGRRRADASSDFMSQIRGEFWLSKQTVDKKGVYFRCSSTLGQASTMCTVLRFSCPTDYLSLIETQAAGVLRDAHIPTNGVVFGVEPDPRHPSLYRMFIEHRNQILDDIVVCECRPQDAESVTVHQELYDGGSIILYRVTLVHRDGSRQAAVLQTPTEQFDDPKFCDSTRSHYQLVEEPSPRFPISPCLVRHNLSPANRVFVYSSVSWDPPEETFVDVEAGDTGQLDCAENFCTPSMPTARGVDSSMMSDATAEDWQSVGGGYSDVEAEQAQPGSKACTGGSGDEPEKLVVRWRRPLVDSLVLMGKMDDAPFACFPTSLS